MDFDDDDDEFGDLYSDVLLPFPSSSTPNPPWISFSLSAAGGGQITAKNPSSDRPLETLATIGDQEPDDVLLPENWDDDDDGGAASNLKEKIEPGVLEAGNQARVSGSMGDGVRVFEEEDTEIVIPGISTGAQPPSSNGAVRASNSEDWDSDSEDDLKIVLNDDPYVPAGGERIGEEEDDDDEDGEDDLVLVTGIDQQQQQQNHYPQAMEDQNWGEAESQPAADGERDEGSEAANAFGAVEPVTGGTSVCYNNQGFHPQQPSLFKYVRPGTAVPSAPGVGPPGQFRPPMGSIAGRGRGEWRPKSFNSGVGPGWANNASRPFGGGLDFTLPSYKTIFDVDIEIFEEKPWRLPGADISDYFNFGLDEDSWKEYFKQLGQLRLESTMQGKIRVYESGRSEQGYDPDLPPELAAASGHHEFSADNMTHAKVDNGQFDFSGQGRGLPNSGVPFPPGRPIQVEIGSGERLPSIDTRPLRVRDADVVIEIVLQDPMEDSTTYNSAFNQPEMDKQEEDLDRRSESEHYDRPPQAFGRMGPRRISHAPEGDSIMPFRQESPLEYNPNSRLRSHAIPAGSFGANRGGRLAEGASLGRNSSTSGNPSNDSNDDRQKEKRGSSIEADQTPEPSPAIAAETAGDLSIGQRDGEYDDIEVEGEETSKFQISGETLGDDSNIQSSKTQKLSSQVERTTMRENNDDDNGSNRIQRESRDEVQDGRSRRAGDMRRRYEGKMDRKNISSFGRETMHHSHPARGRGESFERPRESYSSFVQMREENTLSRRLKDEHFRHNVETEPRNRSKIRGSDRNDKDDDTHLKRRYGRDLRGSSRDDVSSRRDNLDDQGKRKKDEESSRREKGEKEYSRSREDSIGRKRERDENPEHRRSKTREDLHSSKHKDESWSQREREERQRFKHPHEDFPARSGRNKSDSKLLSSDKDSQHRDRRQYGERSKNDSQHKGREDVYAREKNYNNEERSSRHERLSGRYDRSSASDSLQISRERHREGTKKNKETEGSAQNPTGLGKRKHEDLRAHNSEKVSTKGLNELVSIAIKQGEDLASDDESRHESKRGRSKLERWTNPKERDYTAIDNSSSSSIAKEVEITDELPRTESDDVDRHFDTVEKLKKRSERFNLPMPGENDMALSKISENDDAQLPQSEAPVDAEVKTERPARKRRWTSG